MCRLTIRWPLELVNLAKYSLFSLFWLGRAGWSSVAPPQFSWLQIQLSLFTIRWWRHTWPMTSHIGPVLELGLELEPLRLLVVTIDGLPATCPVEMPTCPRQAWVIAGGPMTTTLTMTKFCSLALHSVFSMVSRPKPTFFVSRPLEAVWGLWSSLSPRRCFGSNFLDFVWTWLHQRLCFFAIIFEQTLALPQRPFVCCVMYYPAGR